MSFLLDLECMDTNSTCTSTKRSGMRSRSCASFRKMPAFSTGRKVDISIQKLVDPLVDHVLNLLLLDPLLIRIVKGQLSVHVEVAGHCSSSIMLLHQSFIFL